MWQIGDTLHPYHQVYNLVAIWLHGVSPGDFKFDLEGYCDVSCGHFCEDDVELTTLVGITGWCGLFGMVTIRTVIRWAFFAIVIFSWLSGLSSRAMLLAVAVVGTGSVLPVGAWLGWCCTCPGEMSWITGIPGVGVWGFLVRFPAPVQRISLMTIANSCAARREIPRINNQS